MNQEEPMATTVSTEVRPKRIRTIQTVRIGKSKINIKLADKTLRKLMRERENKDRGAITK